MAGNFVTVYNKIYLYFWIEIGLHTNSPLRFSHVGLWLIAALAAIFTGSLTFAAPTSISLPGQRVFPESLSSAKDGTLYVGDLVEGGVLRVQPNGKVQQWIKPGAFGSASTLGVLVDEPSNTLWICSVDLSSMGVKVAGELPGNALIGFDLKTGRGRVRAAFPGGHNFCNDIAIGPDGAAYVTNSDAPQILRLPAGGTALEVWFSDPSLQPTPGGTGLDGIAFDSDGHLYFNRFDAADLYRVDVVDGKPGKLTKLKPSRPVTLTDGMRPLGQGAFLLIEGAGRVDSMVVKDDEVTITTLGEGYVTPTGVTPVGDTAWVSEGQLDFIFDPAKKGQKPRLPFKLFGVAIPK